MAAPTLETNAGATILRILGGTSGDPVTWNDVWDWDDGGGSSGGDGDVPKDGGGTAKVNTFMTEHVADRLYEILKDADIGDASTSSYFLQQGGEAVYFGAFCYKATSQATLTIGEASNEYGGNVTYLAGTGFGSSRPLGLNSTVNMYNANLHFYSGSPRLTNCTLTIVRATVSCAAATYFIHSAGTFSISDLVIYKGIYGPYGGTATLSEKIQVEAGGGTDAVIVNDANSATTDLLVTNPVSKELHTLGSFNLTLTDPRFNPATASLVIGGAAGWIREQYTCNINITDKDGTALQSVVVDCEDKDGTAAWAAGTVTTDASGDIAEQLITYRQWDGTSETQTTSSPHKFTLSKTGYQTLIIDGMTVSAPIVWQHELQDPAAVAGGLATNGSGMGGQWINGK